MKRLLLIMLAIGLAFGQTERWVYRYNGTGNFWDEAYQICVGPDGNIYVAGYGYGSGTGYDFIVVSLTPSGGQRWIYRYNGPGDSTDCATCIVCGGDGNIYAGGYSYARSTGFDFTVISLTPGGSQRWVYRYSGSQDSTDCAYAVAWGADGNVYAAGFVYRAGAGRDFAVISLTAAGVERWVYRYNGPAGGIDCAYAVACGSDNNIYAAGTSLGSGSYGDFTVVSLVPGPGVAENKFLPEKTAAWFDATVQDRLLQYSFSLKQGATVTLSLYDLQGREVAAWQVNAPAGDTRHARNLEQLHPGAYFLRAAVSGKEGVATRKLIAVK